MAGGIDVLDVPDVAPTSSEARAFFAELLAASPEDVRTFEYAAEAGDRDHPHVHTATLVAWFTSGSMEFFVGDGLTERLEAGVGRCIRVPADTPHSEGVVGDEPVRAVIAHAEDFEVVGIDVPSG
jgi:uncharacterized RmlC-like cupin family protein